MKRRLLFLLMLIGISICVSAQKFEHFKVDTLKGGWLLIPTFDFPSTSGVNGMAGDHSKSILKMIKNAVQTLPQDIKNELKKQDVCISFVFNAKGEIFYINFFIKDINGLFMTDAQWLKVYKTLRKLKIDLSKLILLNNFEWGSGGMYPISKYIREAEK